MVDKEVQDEAKDASLSKKRHDLKLSAIVSIRLRSEVPQTHHKVRLANTGTIAAACASYR